MNRKEAGKIGVKVILSGVVLGLITAFLLMTWIDAGFSWTGIFILEDLPNFFVALISLFYFGFLFGRKAGVDIILNKRNFYLISLKTIFLTLVLGTLSGSLTGFLFEGLPGESFSDAVVDYLFKPFYWILLFGAPFLLIVSILLGWQIKRKGKALEESL